METSSQDQPPSLALMGSQQQQYTESVSAVPGVATFTYGTAAGPYPVEQYTHIIYSVPADSNQYTEISPADDRNQATTLVASAAANLTPVSAAYNEIASNQYGVTSAQQQANHASSDNHLFQPKVVVLPSLQHSIVPSVPLGHADNNMSAVSSSSVPQFANTLLTAGSLEHQYQYYSVLGAVPPQTSAIATTDQAVTFSESVPTSVYAGSIERTESPSATTTATSGKHGLMEQKEYKYSLKSKVPSEKKIVHSICYCEADVKLKDIYTCGCCEETFPLICLLNKHMKSHESVSSYYFSLDTNTAYPKFNQSCRAVQTEWEWFENDDKDCEPIEAPSEIEIESERKKLESDNENNVEDEQLTVLEPEAEKVATEVSISIENDEKESPKPKRPRKRKSSSAESVDTTDKSPKKTQADGQKTHIRKRKPRKETKNGPKETAKDKERDEEGLKMEVVDVEKRMKQDARNVELDHNFARTDTKNRRKQPKEKIVRTKRAGGFEKNITKIKKKLIDTVVNGDVAVPLILVLNKSSEQRKTDDKTLPPSGKKPKNEPCMEEYKTNDLDPASGDETETDSVQLEYARLNDDNIDKNVQDNLSNSKPAASKPAGANTETYKVLKSMLVVKEKNNVAKEENFKVCKVKKVKEPKVKKEKKSSKPKEPKVQLPKTPKEPKVPKVKKPNADLYASCSVCNEIMLQKRLKSHMLLHTGKKEFVCEICGQAYVKNSNLCRHKITHQEIKPFQCKFCPAQFCRKKDFTYHVNSHKDYRPHVCNVCDRRFLAKKGLIQHQLNVHMGITRFQCDMCERRFFKKSGLHAHRATHFDATLECRYCDKKFRDKCALNKHERTHTGQKHYQCHICEHAFNQCTPYFMHMEKRHNIERQKIKDILKIVMEAKKRDGEKVELFRVPSNINEIVSTLKLEEETVLNKQKVKTDQDSGDADSEKVSTRTGPKYRIDLENMGNQLVHHDYAGAHTDTTGDDRALVNMSDTVLSLQALEPMKPVSLTTYKTEDDIKKYYREEQVNEAMDQAQSVQTADNVLNYSLSNQADRSGNLMSLEPVKNILPSSGHPKQKMKLLSQYADYHQQQQQQKMVSVPVMTSGSAEQSKLQGLSAGSTVLAYTTQGGQQQAGSMDPISDTYTATDFLDRILQGH